jgi:hypothetical protein
MSGTAPIASSFLGVFLAHRGTCLRKSRLISFTPAGLADNLFFVLAPQIKEGLRRAVDEMDFSSAGPSRAERIAMIEALDQKIIALDRQETELVEAAEQAGVRL